MKARGLGARNSIVNFLPAFEMQSSFGGPVFFLVLLTDALELGETSHALSSPVVLVWKASIDQVTIEPLHVVNLSLNVSLCDDYQVLTYQPYCT